MKKTNKQLANEILIATTHMKMANRLENAADVLVRGGLLTDDQANRVSESVDQMRSFAINDVFSMLVSNKGK